MHFTRSRSLSLTKSRQSVQWVEFQLKLKGGSDKLKQGHVMWCVIARGRSSMTITQSRQWLTSPTRHSLTEWVGYSFHLVTVTYSVLGGGMQMRLGSWSEETDRQQSLSSQLVTLTVTFQWIDKVVCLYCTFSIQSHGASKLAGQFWVELVSRSLALLPGTDNDTQVWTDKMSGCYSDTTRERRCQALAIS